MEGTRMVNDSLDKKTKSKHVLNQALKVLEYTMELAVQKQDIDAMIGISDRLMILYQHLSEGSVKKFKPGFSLTDAPDKEKENNESN
jgi:hypothetical protein